ncbi:MAG: hypothetical protein JXB30_05585 [Anaerolineae bacterium]|nr:hypothetical protein [Anaerolineae bacterium]
MKKKRSTRHNLLVYSRLGQRLRTAPFLIVIFGSILLFMGWLPNHSSVQGINVELLKTLWEGRILLIVVILCSLALFVLTIIIGRGSYVQVRAVTLHIRAGLLAVNISYKRIRQIRLGQLAAQHPEETLRGSDWALIEPLLGQPCTVVDISSWPWPGKKWLHKLWSKFMFTHDGNSLLFVVKDAMVLNQQIDGRLAALQSSAKKGRYVDPLARAIQAERKQRGQRR